MGKKSKRKVTTKKPPVSVSGGNNDGGRPTNDDGLGPSQLQQQPWSILNSVYFQGLGNIQPYGEIPAYSRAVATEGTYFAPSG